MMRLPKIQIDEMEQVADLLATVPRWGGQTIVPFSVLHHSLVTGRLAEDDTDPIRQLGAYLHDVEEGVVGADIMFGFKTPEQREFQEQIRERIWRSLRIPPLQDGQKSFIQEVDWLVGIAEAEVLMPPSRRAEVWEKHPGETPSDENLMVATDVVLQVARMHPADVRQAFLTEVHTLREEPRVRTMSERL